MENIALQMEAHFSDPKGPISIIGCLVTFVLAFSFNKIHEDAAMYKGALAHYMKDTLVNAFNSRICPKNRLALLVHSVQYERH